MDTVSKTSGRKIELPGRIASWFLLLPMVIISINTYAANDSDRPQSYALLVGSNRPGRGQQALNFAGEDATRMREVLTEIGGFAPGHVQTLYDPKEGELKEALAHFTNRIDRQRESGEQTVFLFYYSGHARATAFNLGDDEIPLGEMRRLLELVPATLKLVVLDACQTGAISNVKGAIPAEEFSRNSAERLNTVGTVIMASSSGRELSQESSSLRGSFFTHHLIVGLRGAADSDRDGQVTLSEAYHYTYNRTLVQTAETAIGRQHVTLERNLQGKGETVLTRPKVAAAWIELPENLAGDILIHKNKPARVVAEVQKKIGGITKLAVTPATYNALIKNNDQAYFCTLEVEQNKTVTLTLENCSSIHLDDLKFKAGREEFYTVTAALQGLVSVPSLKKHHAKFIAGNSTEMSFNDYMYDNYKRYKQAGIALYVVSILAGITSAILPISGFVVGMSGFSIGDDESGGEDNASKGDLMIKTGITIGIIGQVLAPIGIVLHVFGQRRMNRLKPSVLQSRLHRRKKTIAFAPYVDMSDRVAGISLNFAF